MDTLVGIWDISGIDDGTVSCTKTSKTEVDCILSKHGLHTVTFKDGILNWGTITDIEKPTISDDQRGRNVINWASGIIWTETGKQAILLCIIISTLI